MGVFPNQQQRYSNSSRLPLVVLLVVILIVSWPVEATKHSFTTKDDKRLFIGPIGSSFGFLRDGSYSLSVFDYQLQVEDKKTRNRTRQKGEGSNTSSKNAQQQEKEPWQLNEEDYYKEEDKKEQVTFDAAFVLAKFRSESQFERYTENLMENMLQMCSFQKQQSDADGYIFPTENTEFHNEHNSVVLKMTTNNNKSMSAKTATSTTSTKDQKPNSPSIQHTFTQSTEEGLYVLFYQVCVLPPVANDATTENNYHLTAVKLLQQYTISSTFELDIALTNMYKGNTSYLTAGELPLPKMYLFFGVAYAVFVLYWFRLLKSKKITFYIHYIMALLLLLKIATLISDSARYHYIRIYGHTIFWSTVYYFFLSLKGIMLFTTVLLIGSGWSFVKPFLNEREKKIIFLVLILQVLDNIVLVLVQLETEGERLYEDWKGLFHFIDILCCCAALLPIIWQVSILEKSAGGARLSNDDDDDGGEEEVTLHSENDDEDAVVEEQVKTRGPLNTILTQDQQRSIVKLKLFRNFYLIVVTYIYMTRVIVYLVASWLGFRNTWVGSFLNEAATLAFYTSTGYIFQPRDEISYTELKNEEDDDHYLQGQEFEAEVEEEFVNGGSVKSRFQHRSLVELT